MGQGRCCSNYIRIPHEKEKQHRNLLSNFLNDTPVQFWWHIGTTLLKTHWLCDDFCVILLLWWSLDISKGVAWNSVDDWPILASLRIECHKYAWYPFLFFIVLGASKVGSKNTVPYEMGIAKAGAWPPAIYSTCSEPLPFTKVIEGVWPAGEPDMTKIPSVSPGAQPSRKMGNKQKGKGRALRSGFC